MIRVDVFEPADLVGLVLQDGQQELPADRLAQGEFWASHGRAFTGRDARTGQVLLCGGAMQSHPEYATLWSAIGRDAGPAMLALTRKVRIFLGTLPHRRIDALSRVGFVQGGRWLTMLGFAPEATLADYFEDGEAAMLFRKVR